MNEFERTKKSVAMMNFFYFLYVRVFLVPQRFFIIFQFFFLFLSFFLCGELAMAQPTGEIAMAHPPTNSSSSPFVESTGELDALMDTSASSGEPSVNQATPEFYAVEQAQPPADDMVPVEQELEARQAIFGQIRDEMKQQYRADIIRRNPWMRNRLLEQDILQNVLSMISTFELDSLSTAELEQFIHDIRSNPRQLHFIFKEYWPGGK